MPRRFLISRCGARTRKGTPCDAQKIPGRKRCKWHGGLSTGPRTEAGKQRSLQNLLQFRSAEIETVRDGNTCGVTSRSPPSRRLR